MSFGKGHALGDGMRKVLLIALMALLLVGQIFADSSHTSVVTLNSIVLGNEQGNPNIIIGIGTSDGSQFITPDKETTTIKGLNLTKDGSYSFVLMTSEEVILSATKRTQMDIEIIADGFDLYDYDYSGSDESSSDSKLKLKSAVPLLSSTPEIKIPTFYGHDQNVNVSPVGGNGNRIAVMFMPGMTKENLVLGTFTIEWKGKRPLDAGIYMARVSIIYSTN